MELDVADDAWVFWPPPLLQKFTYHCWMAVWSLTLGHAPVHSIPEPARKLVSIADWQKHDTYVCWLETGAPPDGRQPSCALKKGSQLLAQEGRADQLTSVWAWASEGRSAMKMTTRTRSSADERWTG